MSKVLQVDFLVGCKRKEFKLNLVSSFYSESGGIPWEMKYELVIDDTFFRFWNYVKEKYGVDITSQKVVSLKDIEPSSANISQKPKGVNSEEAWISKLNVMDENQVESIIFYPDVCELEGEFADD